jgi:hypothetical protein
MWNLATATTRPDVVDRVGRFVSLDTEAGAEAGRWLRESALANDGSTRTRLLLSETRIEGYFALCAGQTRLEAADVTALGLPPGRHQIPAVVLAWIARHRDGEVGGRELLTVAFGIARRVSREVGAAVFALDARDEAIGEVWQAPPYGFRRSTRERNRLWVPLTPEE